MDTTNKFSGLANDYMMGRPSYSEELIDVFYEKYGFSRNTIVADIGSGTGKFAEQILKRGSFVYGVEPNDDMRDKAIDQLKNYSNFKAINGTATDTTLDADSVDFITAAQAFHWFDVAEFKNECKRILRKDGRVFLVWNMRDMTSEINKRSYAIFKKYCTDFTGFSGGIEKDDVRIKELFDNNYGYMEFDNPLFYDKEKFIARSLSGSYSLKNSDENYDDYIAELSSLFNQNENDGILKMDNKTILYVGKIK